MVPPCRPGTGLSARHAARGRRRQGWIRGRRGAGGQIDGEEIRGGAAQSLHSLLQRLASQPFLGELEPQGFELLPVLALPLSFGGLKGGLLLLRDLQLVGDGGVDRGHLVV